MVLFPFETVARLLVIVAFHSFGWKSLSVLAGCYVLSSIVVTPCAALAIRWWRAGHDPEAESAIRPDAVWRFVRWAVTGTLIDNFDRTTYATLLPAVQRSPYLFFNSLYTAAFTLLANSVALEVLTSRTSGLINSRRGLFGLMAFGLGGAGVCTTFVFGLAGQIGAVTGFDPRPVASAVLYTFTFRALLFVQSLCYGYIERGGLANRTAVPRILGSLVFLAMAVSVARLSPPLVAAVSLTVLGLLALAACGWAMAAIGISESASVEQS
jgi:hypothetical protein